jgi:hypothetical protein
MRKFVYAALLIVALSCFVGASVAYAGDCCCKPKCKQHTCTKCDSCKPKCDSCCKPKCHPCKPKCEPCKPKCNKCEPCKPKCNKCEPCKPKCESKCHKCCKPKCHKCCGCENKCEDRCDMCKVKYHHPYEDCYVGTGMLGDTGCCGVYLPCKRHCVTCETVCKEVKTCDPCTGCEKVEYVYETVTHEVERPRVIPWWFNEKGDGNIYPDEPKEAKEADEGAEAEEGE